MRMSIKDLYNKHEGEVCFIVGTGPSLNETNLSLIEGKTVFGVNALYKSGIKCDYCAIADGAVYRAHIDELAKYDTTLIVDHNAYMIERDKKRALDLRTKPYMFIGGKANKVWSEGTFLKDPTKGFYGGGTIITSIALPMAYYMGFSKVYLVGVDCDYTKGHRFDGSNTENPGGLAGGIFSTEHWDIIFKVYDIFKREFEADGREIINCTVGGKLEVFKRQSLEEVFGIKPKKRRKKKCDSQDTLPLDLTVNEHQEKASDAWDKGLW